MFPMVERVKRIREERQCSLFQARRIAMNELLVASLTEAKTVEELKPILAVLIQEVFH